MNKSVFTDQYARMCTLLVRARMGKGMTQQQLATCLNRPQSYVSKYERGERRLDVVEFLWVVECLGLEAGSVLGDIAGAGAGSSRELVAAPNHDGAIRKPVGKRARK